MMNGCIDPALIYEGDLSALLDGQGTRQVIEHVAACPACQATLARLRAVELGLRARLYRAACPESELLLSYNRGWLSPAERLQVSAHLRQCPRCTQDLAALAERPEAADGLAWAALRRMHNAWQVVEAAWTPPPRTAGLPVRGPGEAASPEFLTCHAPGLDLLLSFVPGADSSEIDLLGAITQAERAAGGQAWLFCEGESPRATGVDILGTFSFAGLVPGVYDLAVEAGEQAVLVRQIDVKAAKP